jgi:hypothetical protein
MKRFGAEIDSTKIETIPYYQFEALILGVRFEIA